MRLKGNVKRIVIYLYTSVCFGLMMYAICTTDIFTK